MGSRNTQQAIAKPASASSASWSDKYVKGALQATGASLVGAGVGAGVASAVTGASFGALALAAAPALGVVAGGLLLGLGVVKMAESASKLVQKLLGGLGMGPSRNSQAQFGPQARQGASDGRDYGQREDTQEKDNDAKTADEPLNAEAQAIKAQSLKAFADSIKEDLKNGGTIQKESLEKLVEKLSPEDQKSVLQQLEIPSLVKIAQQATDQLGIDNPGGVEKFNQVAAETHKDHVEKHYTYAQAQARSI
jgi:hypothetical protein